MIKKSWKSEHAKSHYERHVAVVHAVNPACNARRVQPLHHLDRRVQCTNFTVSRKYHTKIHSNCTY